MRLLLLSGLVLAAGLSLLAADDPAVDPVTKNATQLEAELTKMRSSTGEAAEVMLKLTDLYYQNGRVFGLIRVGQSFVALHTSHPSHKDVMLKLIDGLLITGRNKEVIATSRQFLVRYPKDPACVHVERLLAQLLARGGETLSAASANESLWRRLGPTPEGRIAGTTAISQFAALNNAENFTRAATLGDEMLEKLPAGPAATSVGWQATDHWERVNNWAKANLSAAKLLQKAPPTDKYYLRELHRRMGENYSRVGQRVNAVDSFRKAIDVGGSLRADLYQRLLIEVYQTNPKPADFEPLVAEYLKLFPTRDDRHSYRTLLANVTNAAKDPAKAEQILAEVLPFDARSHNAAGVYVSLIPAMPARTAQAEQVLRDAIAKSTPANAIPLRYSLALELYRDRIKDVAKAKATAREFVYQFPANEGYTGNLVTWLLDSAATDDEFKAEFTKLLATRKEHYYWDYHRNILPGWVTANAAKKEVAKRVEFAKAELAKADKDPVFTDWVALEKAIKANNPAQIAVARAKLLTPETTAKLPDALVNDLFYQQQYYLRQYSPTAQQPTSVQVAKAWTVRLPKSEQAAQQYLNHTTDFNAVKEYAGAAAQMIKIEPTGPNSDLYRRLLQAAAGTKDAALGKQCWAWVLKAQEKYGYDASQSGSMGDSLEALGMKAEALACWKRGMTGYESGDCRPCFDKVIARTMDVKEKEKLLDEMLSHEGYWRFNFAMLKADGLLKAGNIDGFDKLLREAAQKQRERPFGGWNPENDWPLGVAWVSQYRNDAKATPADKRRVFTVMRDLDIRRPSEVAALALLELPDDKLTPIQRLLALNEATRLSYGDHSDWDQMMPYAQSAMTRKDYVTASALVSGMLSSCPNIDEARRKPGRDMVTQAYSRMGAAGAAIDDKSPIAPLLQAALHLRLGDPKLAFDTYLANRKLFDEHRADVPVDLLSFVCESHMAAGGDENFNRVEDILRSWIIKNSESKEFDDFEKARVQLLLARNYFRSKRYDLARAEFNTVLNRYGKTPLAVEAEFGIGETYMEQKVYDQAEQAFERLAGSRERDVVIRAEFLRGVLAGRRGDRDEARAIFRAVLERVPTAELANQVLYNLSEVYGAEQRYMDQLELLRTIGRLGRISKRWHTPGEPLSIVVQDSDLGVSRGHARIPVRVTTDPGGDEEIIYLRSGGAGKGLFRADLETRLGKAVKGDKVLQLTGNDVIRCDYPDEFKKEFRDVPLPDAEIRVAADARFDMASSKIVDVEEENFTTKLGREGNEDDDKRKSTGRPTTQIKPGNLIYLRVKDADRDLTDQPDTITVKLTATSGDQVTAKLTETGPHTGIFEGTVKTGELPAGALATNTAIDHSPLMAIDKDPKTYWISEPDGITPKMLTIDMKDLKRVDKVTISTPDPKQHAPVRGTLEGSNDGRIWFRLAANPAPTATPPIAGEFGRMTMRVFAGQNGAAYTTWDQVIALSKTKPTEQSVADNLTWTRTVDSPKVPVAVLWQGKLVQHRAGAVRIQVAGDTTALMIDGSLEMPVGKGGRHADLWLEPGTHNLTIFAGAGPNTQTMEASWARSDASSTQELPLLAFKDGDFDLTQPQAKPAAARAAPQIAVKEADWEFSFAPVDLRYVRLVIHEYRGEAVAINHVVVEDSVKKKVHIPTDTDLLSLANNDILEIAGGDVVTAAYIDEFNLTGNSRLLTAQLTATYHNGSIVPIAYDFVKAPNGAVNTIRKELLRIDPGDRFIVEVTDFDMDRTAKPDEIKVLVSVNDGDPVELTATETGDNTGIFTREIDTSAKVEKGKFTVKPGDRIYCRYIDEQNTIPGHAVPRETVVYVSEPTEGKLRIVETRVLHGKDDKGPAQIFYLPTDKERKIAGVAFEAPLTVEVIDRDAAKDSRSTVTVQLTTTDGSKVDVECVLSNALFGQGGQAKPTSALEEGRFIGQVILQLGGKGSQSVVPLASNMPRNLIGRPLIPKEANVPANETSLITQVLNLTGKDEIEASYKDERRPKGPALKLTTKARLITDGKLTCTDAEYQKDVTAVHVGERLYLKVVDADHDTTNERDKVKVTITTKRGEKEVVELIETAAHSGVFTGSVLLKAEEKPTPGNLKPEDPIIETWFGDKLEILYVDELASTPSGKLDCTLTVQVVIGTDGKLSAFSKSFTNEALAVETQFHIAESHFELFKSHKALDRDDEAKADLEAGRRVLRTVMRDYPNPKYIPRVAYLLGQFAQELKQWEEAKESYQLIIKQYPDHALAAEAQFRLAQCYEESEDFNQALDAYVTLAATYPKHPLIANVMLRISEHFYKKENYKVAAQVGEKFLERFEGHKWGPKMAFRVGQCYHKDKQYAKAAEAFDRFGKTFPDDALASDAIFWAGESYRLGNNNKQAFIRYNNCRWKYQESEAAKYARGRLALPEMLRQFEESSNLDNK